MNRKTILLAITALLVVTPMAANASELSRRLTLRYPGQDAKKHHHHWGYREHRPEYRPHHESHRTRERRDHPDWR